MPWLMNFRWYVGLKEPHPTSPQPPIWGIVPPIERPKMKTNQFWGMALGKKILDTRVSLTQIYLRNVAPCPMKFYWVIL